MPDCARIEKSIGNLTTDNFALTFVLEGRSFFNQNIKLKKIPKTIVSGSVQEHIEQMRRNLTSPNGVKLNNQGSQDPVQNTGASANSTLTNDPQKIGVPRTVVATSQWYEADPVLQKAEIKAMKDFKPDAQYGFLQDGKMYWEIEIHPEIVPGTVKDYTLLMVYDSDHPQVKMAGSVKVYPVKPSMEDLESKLRSVYGANTILPHIIKGDEGRYICSTAANATNAGVRNTSAVTCLGFAMRWINVFELSLLDRKTWDLFQQHGEI